MTTPHETPGPKTLRRSRRDRMVAGVCGGLAEYFSLDANIIRLIVAVLTFFGGAGAFIYVIGWLLLPEEGEDASVGQRLIQKVQQRQ
ncbi:MAG: PspC domain-containing protein [Streptosporangiales bacterium]|nr:PspC domain-containing protein [Streptosporangiales bacterium]